MLLLASTVAWAGDEHHFIYIQSEKGELFYVRYKGKVLSASAKGYVIVPELPKGTADLIVGFPKNEIPEKHFTIVLTGTRDEGFVIKHTSAQEIALFNLQTYTLLKPVAAETAAAPEAAPATAPAEATAATPTQPAPADVSTTMMNNVKKDLDSTFANNKDVTIAAPQNTEASAAPTATPVTTPAKPVTAPAKQPSKFASALDKVAGDDRPAEMDEPAPAPASAAPAATTAAEVATAPVAAAPASKKGKKPTKPTGGDDVLTPEEQAYLKDVIADEQKTAAEATTAAPVDSVAAQPAAAEVQPATQPAPAPQPVAESSVPAPTADSAAVAYTENTPAPATTKKEKKKKHTTGDDPQFIDFGATAPAATATTAAATTATATATEAATVPVEAAPKSSKKKKKTTSDAAVTDSINNLKSDDWVTVNKPTASAPETATTAAPAAATKATPALNSDCQQMLNNENFKKLMRKVSSQGNEYSMVETFNKNIRNTCLSAEQIRAFAQLIDTDEYRYRLLETAYVHTYETGKFVALQDLLKDDYYKKRFSAMLR